MWYLMVCALAGVVSGRTIIDLTHTFDEDAPKWPLTGFGITNLTYFDMETLYADSSGGIWVEIMKIEFYEHLGTHIDAPSHFGKGRQATHEIPPERLMGPGVMIDVRENAKVIENYGLSVQDIREYEEAHGRIPPGAIVIMNSGWSEKYPDPKLVFSTDNLGDSSTFRFPGYTFEACQMLLQERQVSVVGIDTPSIDPANSTSYACHVLLSTNNVPLIEYVANLDSMPAAGSTVFLGAMKHRGGTGGPVRIFAVTDDVDDNTSGAGPSSFLGSLFLGMAIAVVKFNC